MQGQEISVFSNTTRRVVESPVPYSMEVYGRGVKLTVHFHLTTRLKMYLHGMDRESLSIYLFLYNRNVHAWLANIVLVEEMYISWLILRCRKVCKSHNDKLISD
jgi:hypothetical protein